MGKGLWFYATIGLLAAGLPCLGQRIDNHQPVIVIHQKSPERVKQGETVVVEIIVTNDGTAPAEDLTVTDVLPLGARLLEASPLPEKEGRTLAWSCGSLGPREQYRIRLRVAVGLESVRGETRNTATATYQASVSSNCVLDVNQSELALAVTGPQKAAPGEAVLVQIAVTNNNSRRVDDVLLQARLPKSLLHPLGDILENEVGTLKAGQTRVITLQVTPQRSGPVRALLRATASGVEPVECDLRLTVQGARLGCHVDGPNRCRAGASCNYDFTISNDGSADVAEASLTALLPRGVDFLQASGQGVYDSKNHRVSWPLPRLNRGEVTKVSFTGAAVEVGDQLGRVILKADGKDQGILNWTTQVVPLEEETPVSGKSSKVHQENGR